LTAITRTIQAEPGKTLVIVGPANFQLIDGEATILGAPLDSSRNLVTRGKQTPIEVNTPCSLKVWIGESGDVVQLSGSTIPLSWREAASALSQLGDGTAVVIGGADTGKTTLCTFLANSLTREGTRVGVVDADIGQTDLGPPTTMAAGEVARPVLNLSQVDASERLFIGLTSPGRVKNKVISGVRRLVGYHKKPGELVIVNTDGWVSGTEAVTYKLQILDEIKPDIAFGIGSGDEISEILQAGHCVTLLVGSPDVIKERNQVDRRELRTLGYQKYLAGASVKTLRLDEVKTQDAVSSETLDLHEISRRQVEEIRDAVVGFIDTDGLLQDIGVLKEIIPSAKTLRIWSKASHAPGLLEIGGVKLSEDGRELGYR
jgi:polynucleotide 5'-hydroxyl-kinase GRC3/NOL9